MFFSSKPKAAAGSPDALPADAAPLPPVASGSMDSDSMKKAIIQQVMAESNMTNARQLMEVGVGVPKCLAQRVSSNTART